MKRYICIFASLLFLSSCEKEISLPYRSVDPLYVIEGRVTNEGTEVIVTRTRDMEDGKKGNGLSGAVVTLSADDGTTEILQYGTDGYYRPAGDIIGETGRTYTLSVKIEGTEFASSSQMKSAVDSGEMYFRWLKIMSEKILFCTLVFDDIAGEDNYYCYRMRRNGENYRWHVLHDRGNDGQQIWVDIFCMTEQMAQDNKEEDWEDILYEGDEIEIELQTIDQRTYDYLFSVGLSERTSANPIANFSGGCLGYFAAYSSVKMSTVFSFDDIQP